MKFDMRFNVTLRRDFPAKGFLCTFIDFDNDMNHGRGIYDYVRELFPKWQIVRIWIDDDTERHETLINDPTWHVCSYNLADP